MPQRRLTFDYTPIPVGDRAGKIVGYIYRPLVPIQISYKESFYRPFRALVDSGSDRNLFPAVFGIKVGIDIRKVKPRIIRGIGNYEIKAYTWKVQLWLLDHHLNKMKSLDTEIDFSYEHEVPLLGRSGFFNFFKRVEFRERRRTLELTL